MNLKQMLDEVMLLAGMGTETAYVGSNDSISRLVSIANREAQKLATHPWQALRNTYEFSLSTDTEYSLPTGYRAFVPDTMYTDSHLYGADFQTSADEWAYLQSSNSGVGTLKARIIDGKININQPNSGDTVRVEYWSKYPVLSGTTAQQYFTADTDTFVLDDDLLILKTLARFKRLHGLPDWQVDQAEADRLEQTLRGQDIGGKTVGPCEPSADGPYYDLWRPVPNV